MVPVVSPFISGVNLVFFNSIYNMNFIHSPLIDLRLFYDSRNLLCVAECFLRTYLAWLLPRWVYYNRSKLSPYSNINHLSASQRMFDTEWLIFKQEECIFCLSKLDCQERRCQRFVDATVFILQVSRYFTLRKKTIKNIILCGDVA